MKLLIKLWILMCPALASVQGQKISEIELFGIKTEILRLDSVIEKKYGPDQRLYNGVAYYNLHTRSYGHKFLDGDFYQEGKLVIDNQRYENVLLKYDIYNQQVLIQFQQGEKGDREIIVNNQRLNEFELGDRIFRKFTLPGNDTLICQIYEGPAVSFMFYRRKTLIPRIRDSNVTSEFRSVRHRSFVLLSSGLFEFTHAKSLALLFPEYKSELRRFMRKEIIRPGTATDLQIRRLHEYCNEIMTQKTELP